MLAENIAKLRKERGIKQIEFARMLHVTQGAVSQWENNRTRPDTEQLIAIAALFGVSVDSLTGIKEAPVTEKQKTAREEFNERFDKMSEADKDYIIRMMDFMISQNKIKEE